MRANKLTLDSRVGELYASPVGHDALSKVLMQLGLDEKLLKSPLVANLKLKKLAALTYKKIGPAFWFDLLHLVNTEPDLPAPPDGPITPKWWKEAVFYQIYPRSFWIPTATASAICAASSKSWTIWPIWG